MLEDAPDGDVRVTEAADALLDILHDRLGTYDDGYEADSDDDAAQAVPDFNSLVEFPPLPAATGLAPAIELGAWANPCAL